MKNRIIYLLFSTLVIVLTTIFLPVIGGKPLLDWNLLQRDISNRQEVTHTPVFTSVGPSEPTTVYRWKEQDNIWHFSQTPAPHGTRYETILIDADHSRAALSDTIPPNTEATQANIPSFSSLYSPTEIERILQQAENAQKLMHEHQKKLDAMLNDTRP